MNNIWIKRISDTKTLCNQVVDNIKENISLLKIPI